MRKAIETFDRLALSRTSSCQSQPSASTPRSTTPSTSSAEKPVMQ